MKYGNFLEENAIIRYKKEYIKYSLLKDIIIITKNTSNDNTLSDVIQSSQHSTVTDFIKNKSVSEKTEFCMYKDSNAWLLFSEEEITDGSINYTACWSPDDKQPSIVL